MTSATQSSSVRLASLDTFRGGVMLLMMAEVLRFCEVATPLPASGLWRFLCAQQSHVEWAGCSLHDLIQPAFSFLVGAALPFSLAARTARGQSGAGMLWHAAWRSFVLVALGVFLRSLGQAETNWTFEDTLSQIGLGYFFLFLLARRSARDQWLFLFVILVGYWLAFVLYPAPAADFDYGQVGVAANSPHLQSGMAAHWNKNSNLAWAFDAWFLNLFPRSHPFAYNEGGYATLNFIPTLGTMLFGLIAGRVIQGQQTNRGKMTWLACVGGSGLLVGAALGWMGICPVVKRIWTPSWVLFSAGWCIWILGGLYLVMDVMRARRWAFPVVIVGRNSIAAYVMAHTVEGFIEQAAVTHLGRSVFRMSGNPYEPLLLGSLVLAVLWLILLWMHHRKIYLRV